MPCNVTDPCHLMTTETGRRSQCDSSAPALVRVGPLWFKSTCVLKPALPRSVRKFHFLVFLCKPRCSGADSVLAHKLSVESQVKITTSRKSFKKEDPYMSC